MKNYLLEAITQKKQAEGQVRFLKSGLDDPHIIKIIDFVAEKTGKSKADIRKKIQEEIDKIQSLKAKAPILYHTIAENVAESEAFDLLSEVDVEGAPRFNVPTFYRLIRRIRAEHDSLFPLRNFIDKNKRLENPRYVLVPSPNEPKSFNDVETAAATPSGEFIFNTKFMQQLLDYAHLKGIKPKSKKYKSNGGDFPDEWAFIEFLILHEFMHYSYADFHYAKIYKADPNISNWVGDFRSNYDLVKNGHEQLPIGLYNDKINMDRQKTWKEMYDLVKSEFEKLNKDQQRLVEKHLGELENGEHMQGDDADAEDAGNNVSPEDAERHAQDVREKIQGGKEIQSEKDASPRESESKKSKGQTSSSRVDTTSEFDYSKVKPKFSWSALLARFIKNASDIEEPTYQKPSRRSVTGAHIAAQVGHGVVKPSEIKVQNSKLKIAFVIDSSGSMTSSIATAYANIEALIKNHAAGLANEFVLIKFSNGYKVYQCSISGSAGSYVEVPSALSGVQASKMKQGNLKQLFSEHFGSATNFTIELANELKRLIDNGYSVLLITDSDILDSENKKNLIDLYKHDRQRVFIIADSRHTFSSICAALREISANVTHF